MLGRIEAEFAEPIGRVLAESIFGHTDAARVRDGVVAFCDRELDATPAELIFFTMSVGAVFGLRLTDGRDVVVKVHLPREGLDRLACVQRVQRHLADESFPCPRPVGEPARLVDLPATVEEHVGGGEHRDAHDPGVRRTMAATLARLVRLTAEVDDVEPLGEGWSVHGGEALWGEPHNALFDFEATAGGAEWIDRLAASARAEHRPGRRVVAHADWSVKHFRFLGPDVHTIYDWDSLTLDSEASLVAGAAVHFPYTETFDVPRVASLEELRAFVTEYEHERPEPFSPEETRSVAAAAVLALAYTARCEHARNPSGGRPEGSFRDALARFGEELLA